MFVLVFKGIVREIINEPHLVHPDCTWIDIGDSVVEYGSTYKDGVFTAPKIPEPKIDQNTEFVAAVKKIIPKLAEFVAGTATKEDIAASFDEVKGVFEITAAVQGSAAKRAKKQRTKVVR